MGQSLYHYVISFYFSCYSLCFRVCFLWYRYCHPCFLFIPILMEYPFSISLLFSLCVFLGLKWVSCRQELCWSWVFIHSATQYLSVERLVHLHLKWILIGMCLLLFLNCFQVVLWFFLFLSSSFAVFPCDLVTSVIFGFLFLFCLCIYLISFLVFGYQDKLYIHVIISSSLSQMHSNPTFLLLTSHLMSLTSFFTYFILCIL